MRSLGTKRKNSMNLFALDLTQYHTRIPGRWRRMLVSDNYLCSACIFYSDALICKCYIIIVLDIKCACGIKYITSKYITNFRLHF